MPQQNFDNIPRERPPILQTKISKSRDGKWIIFRTIITEIKSVNYIQEILRSTSKRGAQWQEEDQT